MTINSIKPVIVLEGETHLENEKGMKLVVVIPAFNEAETIESVVSRVPRFVPGTTTVDVIVIDDGSTDQTVERARGVGAKVVSHHRNLGSGAAFHTGLRSALTEGADLIVTIDADLQFRPEDITPLVGHLLEHRLDFVSCTRFLESGNCIGIPWIKRAGNQAVTRLVNAIAGSAFTDVSCGFRVYRKTTALRLNLWSTFDYAQETLIRLFRAGFRMGEISLPVRGVREIGESKIAHNVLSYGFRCLSILLYTMRDLRPLRFFGSLAIVFFSGGAFLGLFVLLHWARTGGTHPYTSFLIGSTLGLTLAFIFMTVALLADMIARQGRVTEEIWYLSRMWELESVRRHKSSETVLGGCHRES